MKKKKGIIIYTVFSVCILILLCILYMGIKPIGPVPLQSTPVFSWKTTKINCTVIVTINISSTNKTEISSFKVCIINNTGMFDNNTRIWFYVDDMIDNENGNITFYDKDNDSKISTGDEFVIKGDLADKMDEFRLVWIPTGGTSFLIRRGVDY